MNKEKGFQIGAVAVAAVSIVAALVFFFTNCVNLTATKRYNAYFAIIFIVMIALTVYLTRMLVKNKEWSYPRLFVILAIGWTFCMQLVMPPISGPDEVQHYYSAYHCSNIMLGMKDHNLSMDTSKLGSWVPDESFFYMRGEDYYMMPYLDVTFPYQYAILAQGNYIKHADDMQENVKVYIAPSKASRYLVSGAGITLIVQHELNELVGLAAADSVMDVRLGRHFLFAVQECQSINLRLAAFAEVVNGNGVFKVLRVFRVLKVLWEVEHMDLHAGTGLLDDVEVDRRLVDEHAFEYFSFRDLRIHVLRVREPVSYRRISRFGRQQGRAQNRGRCSLTVADSG